MLDYKDFKPKGVTNGQVFTFTFIETKKYNKYEVATRKSKKFFGTIRWFFPWEQYCLFPEDNISVMSSDMMFDVYSFINYLDYDLKEEQSVKRWEKELEEIEKRIKSPEEIAILIKNDKDELLKEGKRLLEFYPNIQYETGESLYLILALSEYYRLEGGRIQFYLGKATTGFQGWLMGKRLYYLNEWMENNPKN